MTTPITNNKILVPLMIEPHPRDYAGLSYVTLVVYNKKHLLVIVDNMDATCLKAYVLDLCRPAGIDEEVILTVANYWFVNNRTKYPVSIEFSRLGIADMLSEIYLHLNVEYISRVIGPISTFPMGEIRSIKKRRCKTIPLDQVSN